MAHRSLESELKIPVTDFKPVRAALHRERAVVVQAMAREINLLLDTQDEKLRKAGSLLRLRQHGDREILTFKGPVSYHGAVKERVEHEAEFRDLGRMVEIFGSLGFSVSMRYEKDREEWLLGEFSVVLDHTPMGNFVEVEGPPERLEQTARLLGLDTATALRGSYVSLWLEYRALHPELHLPADMVFDQ
jgi:adenylate cyclase, class 2